MRSTKELFSHAAETARRFRERGGQRQLVDAAVGVGSSLTRLYVDGVDLDKVRLTCRLIGADGEPTGDQFPVIVQSFGATAAENRVVDLTKPVVPPIVAGMWVLGSVINGDWECVSPPFLKAGEC